MTTILLIPGGWHGGWWFRPITNRLRAAGHDVHPITLTGLGERAHLGTATANLDTHIDDVTRVIEFNRLTDIVLCAHSYGGMVATAVADRLPDRISALVAVDAQIPHDGESLWSLTTDQFRQAFIDWAAPDGAFVAPPPGLDPRATPHPLASFIQPVRLTGAWQRVDRRYYVWMSGWAESPTKLIYDRLRDDPHWEVASWPIGHDVIGEGTDRLVTLLVQVTTDIASHPGKSGGIGT